MQPLPTTKAKLNLFEAESFHYLSLCLMLVRLDHKINIFFLPFSSENTQRKYSVDFKCVERVGRYEKMTANSGGISELASIYNIAEFSNYFPKGSKGKMAIN